MAVEYPDLSNGRRISRLAPPTGNVRMVLDTDANNEIDDQFAVVYALLSPDKLSVEAIHAAPFHNHRSNGPEQGVERSFGDLFAKLDQSASALVDRAAASDA